MYSQYRNVSSCSAVLILSEAEDLRLVDINYTAYIANKFRFENFS